MAQQGRINFGIGFQVDKTGLNQLRQELSSLSNLSLDKFKLNNPQGTQQQLDKLTQEAKELSSILNQSYNFKLNTINLDQFNRKIKETGFDMTSFATKCNQAGVEGALTFRKLTQTLSQVNSEVKQSHKLLDSMAQTLTNTVKWTIASSAVNAFTGSITKAYDYTKRLDQSLNDIRIVTEKSSDEMARFAKQANSAARALGATTTDYTQASLIYYQQGLSDKEVAARTEVTTKVANVTGQSAADTSDQLTAIWNGYKVTAQEAELYIDKVSAVAARTGADLEELSEGMGKVASAANSMGVDIDQLNASLATVITVTREDANAVGTAFKTIYARMGDLAVEGKDEFGTTLGQVSSALQTMGVDIIDSQGQMREMGDVIEEVAGKWNTWTRAQQQAAAVALAGKRQYNNLIALFENWDMYESAKADSKNSENTLQKQNEIYLESIEAHMNNLTTASQKLYDTIFDPEMVNKVLDGLTSIVDLVDGFINTLGGIEPVLLTIGALMTSIFSKQIGNALNTTIQNKFASTRETEELKAQQELTAEMRANAEKAYNDAVARIEKLKELQNKQQTDEGKLAYQKAIDEAEIVAETQNDTLKGMQLAEQAAAAGLSKSEIDLILADYNKASEAKVQAKQAELDQLEKLRKQELEAERKQAEAIKQIEEEEANARTEAEETFFNQGRSRRSGLPYDADQVKIDYNPNAPTGKGNRFNTQQVSDTLKRAERELVTSKDTVKEQTKGLKNKKGITEESLAAYKAETDALAKKAKELGISATAQGDLNKAQKEYREIMAEAQKELEAGTLSEETRQAVIKKSNILTTELTKNIDGQIAKNKDAQKYFEKDAQTIKTSADKKKQAAKEVADATKKQVEDTKEALAQEVAAREAAEKAAEEQAQAAIKAAETQKKIEKATQGFTQLAGGVLSVVAAFQQLNNLTQIWQDEETDIGTKIGQTVTVVLSASMMLLPALVSIDKAMKDMKGNTLTAIKAFFGFSTAEVTGTVTSNIFAVALEKLKTAMKNVGKAAKSTGGQIAIIISLITAAIKVAEFFGSEIEKMWSVDDTKMVAASDAADSLAESYNNARSAYEELQDSMSKYDDMQDQLDQMVVGTDEWTDSLAEANRQVLELVKQYSVLAQYIKNDNGRLSISQEGFDVLEEQMKNEQDRAYIAMNSAQISARTYGQQQKSAEALNQAQERYVNQTMQWQQDISNIRSAGTAIGGGIAGGFIAAGAGAGSGAAAGATAGTAGGPLGIAIGAAIGLLVGVIAGGVTYAADEAARKAKAENAIDDATNKIIDLAGQEGNEDMFSSEERFREVTAHLKLDESVTEVLWENAHELKAISEDIKANTAANNAAAEAIAHTVLQDDTTYQNSRYKEGLIGLVGEEYQNLAQKIYDEELADKSGDDDDILLAQKYERMMQETGKWVEGTAEQQGWGSTKTKLKYKTAEGTSFIEEEIDDERMRQELMAYEASKRLGSVIKPEEIEEIFLTYERSLGTGITDALQSFTLGRTGDLSSLTETELAELMGQDISKILTDEQAKKLGYEDGLAGLEKAIEDANRNLQISMKNSLEAMLPTARKIYDELADENAGVLEEFTIGQKKAITTMISDAFSRGGSEGAEAMAGFIEKNISADEFDKFTEIYNEIDWSKGTATNELLYNLKQAGITIEMNEEELAEFEETMKKSANAAKSIAARFNDIRKELTEIKKIGEDIELGEVITDEDYEKLVKANREFEHMFMMTADGWQFIGGNMEQAMLTAQRNIADLDNIRTRYAAITDQAEKLNDTNITTEQDMFTFASNIGTGEYNDILAEAGSNAEEVDKWREWLISGNEEQQAEAKQELKALQAKITQVITNGIEGVYSEVNADTVKLSMENATLAQARVQRDAGAINDEAFEKYKQSLYASMGLSEEALEAYIANTYDITDMTDAEIEALEQMIYEQIKYANALEALNDIWTQGFREIRKGNVEAVLSGEFGEKLSEWLTSLGFDDVTNNDKLTKLVTDDDFVSAYQRYIQGDAAAISTIMASIQKAGFSQAAYNTAVADADKLYQNAKSATEQQESIATGYQDDLNAFWSNAMAELKDDPRAFKNITTTVQQGLSTNGFLYEKLTGGRQIKYEGSTAEIKDLWINDPSEAARLEIAKLTNDVDAVRMNSMRYDLLTALDNFVSSENTLSGYVEYNSHDRTDLATYNSRDMATDQLIGSTLSWLKSNHSDLTQYFTDEQLKELLEPMRDNVMTMSASGRSGSGNTATRASWQSNAFEGVNETYAEDKNTFLAIKRINYTRDFFITAKEKYEALQKSFKTAQGEVSKAQEVEDLALENLENIKTTEDSYIDDAVKKASDWLKSNAGSVITDFTAITDMTMSILDQEIELLELQYQSLTRAGDQLANLQSRLSAQKNKIDTLSLAHSAEYAQYEAELNIMFANFYKGLSQTAKKSLKEAGLDGESLMDTLFTSTTIDGITTTELNNEAFLTLMNWFNAHGSDLLGLNLEDGELADFMEIKEKIFSLNEEFAENTKEYQEALQERAELLTQMYDLMLDSTQELANATRNANATLREFKLLTKTGIAENSVINSFKEDATAAKDAIDSFHSALDSMTKGDNIKGDTNFFEIDDAAALMEAEKYYQAVIDEAKNYYAAMTGLEEEYLIVIEERNSQYEEWLSYLDRANGLLEHQLTLNELLNGETDYTTKSTIMDTQITVAAQKQNAAAKAMQDAKASLEAYEKTIGADATDATYRTLAEAYASSVETWYGSVEEAATAVQEKYLNDIEGAFAEFEDRLLGMTMDGASKEWDWVNAQNERWLDNVNAAYGLRDLERQFTKAIDQTQSVSMQQKLNQLREVELKALKEKDKLTQYDLDRAAKRLEIAQAEIALQEAQANKSKMRLVRGANGQYSYQYVADTDAIAEAEENLDRLNNELYNLDKEEYINSLSEIKDMYSQMAEEAKEIMQNMSLTEEERQTKLNDLVTKYTAEMQAMGVRSNEIYGALADIADNAAKGIKHVFDAVDNFNKTSVAGLADTFSTAAMNGIATGLTTKLQGIADAYQNSLSTIFGDSNGIGSYESLVSEAATKIGELADALATVPQVIDSEYLTALKELQTKWLEPETGIAAQLTTATEGLKEAIKARNTLLSDGGANGTPEAETADNTAAILGVVKVIAAAVTKNERYLYSDEGWINAKDDAERAAFAQQKYSSTYEVQDNMEGLYSAEQVAAANEKHNVWYAVYQYYAKKNIINRLENEANYMSGLSGEKRQEMINKLKQSLPQYEWALHAMSEYDTGGYTGEWGADGRIAMLHEKELVLNKADTANILQAVDLVRSFDEQITSRLAQYMNAIDSFFNAATLEMGANEIEQTVHITAEFPNATDKNEIEEAFRDLVNLATQRAFKNTRT